MPNIFRAQSKKRKVKTKTNVCDLPSFVKQSCLFYDLHSIEIANSNIYTSIISVKQVDICIAINPFFISTYSKYQHNLLKICVS